MLCSANVVLGDGFLLWHVRVPDIPSLGTYIHRVVISPRYESGRTLRRLSALARKQGGDP